MSRKSSTKVGLNAKISSINLQSIPFDGSAVIPEGAAISFDSNGVAQLAGPADPCYINFVDSARADVLSEQGDPFQDTLAARNTEGGTLTGIRGDGVDIGLPASCWNGGELPDVGEYVSKNNGVFAAGSMIAGVRYHGIVERIAHGKAYFSFRTVPAIFAAPFAP